GNLISNEFGQCAKSEDSDCPSRAHEGQVRAGKIDPIQARRPGYNRRRRHGSQPCYYSNAEGQEQRKAGIHESSPIVIVDSHASRQSGVSKPMFLSGRSRQQSDANLTSVEVCVSVSSTLKHQRCRNPCFWKFVSLHPICKIEVHLRPESFFSIREYASYYRLPLWRIVVGQYLELETLPYLNFRLHLNSLSVLSFRITNAPGRETLLVQRVAAL